ncbi:protein misato homolog 1 [Menidia menidia]
MSSVCREVITLQLGHYSNFVGTHWWNLQDASLSYDPDSPPSEIQSDAVFREGQTPAGHVTYTPRLIAMDLKGSLRTLRQEGSLYGQGQGGAPTWSGSLMMHQESPPEKNLFLEDLDLLDNGEIPAEPALPDPARNPSPKRFCSDPLDPDLVDPVGARLARVQKGYRLESSVRVWSDFLRIHLHPRSIAVIHQYNHDGEADRLEAFGQGEAVLQGALLEELEDRLHFFVEECDYLQGFQVLVDLSDGFSGLGSRLTELLQDSYGGRGLLTWGLAPAGRPPANPLMAAYGLLNGALGALHMSGHSTMFCPLTLGGGLGRTGSRRAGSGRTGPDFPLLRYDPALWYHSSSVLALALDALTAPYRLRTNGVPMWQLADSLAVSGRKVVAAYGALPFPMMLGGSLPDALSACDGALPWRPLSACPEASGSGRRCFGQWATLRGLEGQRLVSCLPAGVQPTTPLHGLDSGEDVLESFLSSFYPSSPLAVQLVAAPSRLTPPFPQIFSPSLGADGFLHSDPPPAGSEVPSVSSVPVLTSLQSGPAVGSWLSELHRVVSAVDVRRVAPSFLSQGPELADYQEALEQLRLLGCCYRDDSGPHSSSEDDSDD